MNFTKILQLGYIVDKNIVYIKLIRLIFLLIPLSKRAKLKNREQRQLSIF